MRMKFCQVQFEPKLVSVFVANEDVLFFVVSVGAFFEVV